MGKLCGDFFMNSLQKNYHNGPIYVSVISGPNVFLLAEDSHKNGTVVRTYYLYNGNSMLVRHLDILLIPLVSLKHNYGDSDVCHCGLTKNVHSVRWYMYQPPANWMQGTKVINFPSIYILSGKRIETCHLSREFIIFYSRLSSVC